MAHRQRFQRIKQALQAMTLGNEGQITPEQWEALIGRLAARALVEYREPFERPALRRHLPDLAHANPRLPVSKRFPRTHVRITPTRLLRSNLDIRTLRALLIDERPRDKRRLPNPDDPDYKAAHEDLTQRLRQQLDTAIEPAKRSGDWGWVADLLETLQKIGIDVEEPAQDALNAAIEEAKRSGHWWTVALVLETFWKLGNNLVEADAFFVRHGLVAELKPAIEQLKEHGYWWWAAITLKTLQELGSDIEEPAQDVVNAAIDHAILRGNWETAADFLGRLQKLGIDVDEAVIKFLHEPLVSALPAAIEEAAKRRHWTQAADLLERCHKIGIDVGKPGREVLNEALEWNAVIGAGLTTPSNNSRNSA